MWTEPKTDWQRSDYFDLDPDYRRIRGNMLELHRRAKQLYSDFALPETVEYSIEQLPYLELFEGVEQSLAQLCAGTLARGWYSTRQLRENAPVWDWRDLNRIETIQRQLERDLCAAKRGRTPLQFRMGGGAFAAFI